MYTIIINSKFLHYINETIIFKIETLLEPNPYLDKYVIIIYNFVSCFACVAFLQKTLYERK